MKFCFGPERQLTLVEKLALKSIIDAAGLAEVLRTAKLLAAPGPEPVAIATPNGDTEPVVVAGPDVGEPWPGDPVKGDRVAIAIPEDQDFNGLTGLKGSVVHVHADGRTYDVDVDGRVKTAVLHRSYVERLAPETPGEVVVPPEPAPEPRPEPAPPSRSVIVTVTDMDGVILDRKTVAVPLAVRSLGIFCIDPGDKVSTFPAETLELDSVPDPDAKGGEQ
jgi:hypothetical protein